MWGYLRRPFEEIYYCLLLFASRRTDPEGARTLRFLLAKRKVLRRRLKAIDRVLQSTRNL